MRLGWRSEPRSTLRAHYVRVLVWCKACRHQANADLQALLDAGRGDVPLNRLRFRCANCRSRLTDFLVTSLDEALRILYLRTLARTPTDREVQKCRSYIAETGRRIDAFEDILWSLLNSTEFLTKR